MNRKYSDFHIKAIEKVKKMWQMYIINSDPNQLEQSLSYLPQDLLMIGTGHHEFYKNRKEFIRGMSADQVEARNTEFELRDEWYNIQEISEDVCVVYGSIWAREKITPDKSVIVDMEGSRFTVVCRQRQGKVEICSIHHSMPYLEQGEDEYYPKSLISMANEAVQKNKVLEQRVEIDHMTELYNRVYFEQHVSQVMNNKIGYFFAIDLDDFKTINDSKGHLMGDKVIKEFANLLRSVANSSAIIGRMGGDEFAVWDSGVKHKNEAEVRCRALTKGCHMLSEKLDIYVNCSIGIAVSGSSDGGFVELYNRADQALYQAKSRGKGCFCWAEER